MPVGVVVLNSSNRARGAASLCMNTRCVLQEDSSENDEVFQLLYFSHVEKFSYSSKHALYFINYLWFFLTFHHVRLTNNSGLSLRSTDWKSALREQHRKRNHSTDIIRRKHFSIFHPDPAKILRRPQNSTTEAGGNSAILCEAEGNPTPAITWTRGETDVIVGCGSKLVFYSAQLCDEGWYTCSSKNNVGPEDRASVYLEVTGKNDYLPPNFLNLQFPPYLITEML